jgi:GntR family transcriptional regulator, rspAB operon transcriptional repressor
MVSFLRMEPPKETSLRDRAYRIIRNKIVTCEFPPGSPLNERELVELIGVSRTPIREALNRLENEQLVTLTSQKGATVTPITPKVINDIFHLRYVLEPHVVSVVTPDFPEKVLLEFKTKLADRDLDNYEEIVTLDGKLHFAIIHAFGNSYLNNLMENMYTQNERIRRLSTMMPQRLADSAAEHLAIVEAMLTRDPLKAADATRDHLQKARYVAFRI